jgi:hypothetical protein
MTDATIVSIVGAASPILIALAALIKAFANSIDTRTNSARIDNLQELAKSAHARVESLEIGNLADAAAKGEKDNPK